MKKVLLLITVPFDGYGISKIVFDYALNIKENCELHFFLCQGGLETEITKIHDNGFKLITNKYSRLKQVIHYLKYLNCIVKNGNYDAVHVHGNSGTMFLEIHTAKKCGVPIRIAHCHNDSCNFKIAHYLLKPFLNKEMTVGLACSNQAARWCFNSNYHVLNNAINLEHYAFSADERKSFRDKYHLDDKVVLLNIGRLTEQKNQSFLLDLMNELKGDSKFQLLIYGDGELESELKEKISKLKLDNVSLMGKTSDLSSVYSGADLFLFPSIYEGLGLVAIEAQASGLSCIASTKVPLEANAGNAICYCDLDDRTAWLNEIKRIRIIDKNERVRICFDNQGKIAMNGYDIKQNSIELTKIYNGVK